jgi:outer membrane protein TolC
MFIVPWPSAARPWRRAGCALALATVLTNAALAQAIAEFTLDQALQVAQQRSRQLPAQQAAASAAREMAIAAAQLPDPWLKAGITNLPTDGPDRFRLSRDFMTMRSVGVMQEFTRSDKRRARAARFEREAEVAEAAQAAALAALRRETAKAWLDRHYQERMRELLQDLRRETALQAEAAEAAYRGSRGSQADVFAARIALAQVDERLKFADQSVAVASTRLARWTGDEARRPLAPPPPMVVSALADADLDTRIAHHPDIAMTARQEAVALAEADIAQRNRRPDWSVEVMFSQRGSAYSNMVSIGVSIPLQWDRAQRQDRELAAKLALVEHARAQREEVAREHAADLRAWQQAWQGQRERIAHLDRTLLPLAGQRTQAALAAYRSGSGPLEAVLDARRMEIDTRIERLRLEADAAGLWAQIEYLVAPPQAAATPAGPGPSTQPKE